MKPKYNILIFCCLFLFGWANAQQNPAFSLYNYNMNVINPAYAGASEITQANLNIRNQWLGIEGAPEVKTFSMGAPVSEKVGLGASLVLDKVHVISETNAFIDFSYKIKISSAYDLHMGLKAGAQFIVIDLNSLDIANDPLFTENVDNFNPNVGIGFYLKGERFYANISAPSLLNSKRFERQAGIVTNATNKPHFYAGMGYRFNLSKEVGLIPSALTRVLEGAPLSMDLTATFEFNRVFQLGFSHRLDESITGFTFIDISDWLGIGYAYDKALTAVADYGGGSHEFMLRLKVE